MGLAGEVVLYSAVIVLGAIAGGWIPLQIRNPARTVSFLAFAAGVLFGAAFFHMLPEAFHAGGYSVFSWVPVGFLALFVLERYVLVHMCEQDAHEDQHEHRHGSTHLGLAAFFGLSAHTLFDGVALGAACAEGVGLMAFLAIAAHKVPSSISLASILQTDGRGSKQILMLSALFGLMAPLGAALYFALDAALHFESLAPKALSFSAGTFLYIAASDLLPRVHRDGQDQKLKHIAALALGVLMMFGLTALSHGHGGHR